MNFNRGLTAAVVVGFVGICSFVLLGRRNNDGASWSPTTSGITPSLALPEADVTKRMLTSSVAKQTFIDKVVANFNNQRIVVGQKVVMLGASHGTSGAIGEDLKEGRKKPDPSSPGDESWIRIANDAWMGAYNIGGSSRVYKSRTSTCLTSPRAFATARQAD